LNEEMMIQRAQNGELEAFQQLVELHKKDLYFLSLNLTGNQYDAEDLSQEVFIKAYQGLKGFRGDAKFGSWLYRIAVNTNINRNRKKSVRTVAVSENIGIGSGEAGRQSQGPDSLAEAAVIQEHIERAMQRLTDRERTVFVLRHYHDYKLKEIAGMLRINTGTVKSTLFRAIQRLQEELEFYRDESGKEEYR